MKTLKRNHITIYYALAETETDTYDEYGNLTGSPHITYGDPIRTRMVWGARSGGISVTAHGLEENYSQVLMTDDTSCPMTIGSIVWIHKTPMDGQGNAVPHTHVVAAVVPTFNSITYRLQEVAHSIS
jgi:hypothetical protein